MGYSTNSTCGLSSLQLLVGKYAVLFEPHTNFNHKQRHESLVFVHILHTEVKVIHGKFDQEMPVLNNVKEISTPDPAFI